MKLIQTTIEVDDERRATIQLPADVTPGPYQAVVVIEDRGPVGPRPHPTMADFPRHDVQVNLPEDFTFRREQIYDDSGRGADPVFVDTNILVYAAIPAFPLHGTALARLDAFRQASVELWLSRQILREYLATLTRP